MKDSKVGDYAWMLKSNGKMAFSEKIKLIKQIMLPTMSATINTAVSRYMTPHTLDLDFQQIIIPDTAMVRVAMQELQEKADLSLIHHSWRTYFWGAALGELSQQKFDPEMLLTAALFHDIGLTEQHLHSKGCRCFTYQSALQFDQRAAEIHFAVEKREIIKNAICLHMNGDVDKTHPAEVILLQQGAACDVVGNQFYRLPESYRTDVLTQYPREKFNQKFKVLLKHEAKQLPHSRTALLMNVGLPIMIDLNPFAE